MRSLNPKIPKVSITVILTLILLTSGFLSVLSINLSTAQSNNSEITFIKGSSGSTFVDTFNTFKSSYANAQTIISLVYPWLLMFSPDMNSLEPYLATSWDINLLNHTAIFHLNQNAKWSDGVPITAQDVVFSYNTYMQPWSHYKKWVSSITSVTALNNYTVKFTITGISFEFLAIDLPIVPYHIWKNVNLTSYSGFSSGSTFVGGGPFLISSYTPSQSVVLVKNPNFWDPSLTPHIDKLIFQNFASSTSELAALESGEIDVAGISITDIPSVKNNTNLAIVGSPGSADHYLVFNQYPNGSGNPTLRDIHVREALAYALNISYLIQLGYKGYAIPGVSLVNPGNPFCNPYLKPWPYNVTLANKILDEYGYKYGPNGIRESPNGTPLIFNLWLPSGFTTDINLAPVMVKYWQAIGVKVNVQVFDSATLSALEVAYKHDMVIWDWNSMPNWPSELYVHLTSSIPEDNDAGYSNHTYDMLYNELMNATSITQAKIIAYEMQNLTYYALAYLNMYYPEYLTAYNIQKWTNINTSVVSQAGIFGFAPGIWNYLSVEPKTQVTPSEITPMSPIIIGSIIVIIVIILAVISYIVYKKKQSKKGKL